MIMANQELTLHKTNHKAGTGLTAAILRFASDIPSSTQLQHDTPNNAARNSANAAARSAALVAGSLALPTGPLGWLTILPEMVTIWKIQSQMVADIVAIYGKTPSLTREQMIYCMFRHSAAQAVRDLVVRVGDRVLIQQVPLQILQAVAHKIGVKLSKKIIGTSVSRWLPVVGAIGVSAYAYYDTKEVAATAIKLCEQTFEQKS
jgi:hypothetical protein